MLSETLEIFAKLGFPAAILLVTFWGIYKATQWIGTSILLPLSTKHLEFLDYQIQHSQRTTEAITALSESTESISKFTEKIHESQSEIRNFQGEIVDTQNRIAHTQEQTLETAKALVEEMRPPIQVIPAMSKSIEELLRRKEVLEHEIHRIKHDLGKPDAEPKRDQNL